MGAYMNVLANFSCNNMYMLSLNLRLPSYLVIVEL